MKKKMNSKMTAIFMVIMIVIVSVLGAVPTSIVANAVTMDKNVRGYPIPTYNIPAYLDSGLTQRDGTVYPSDEIYISMSKENRTSKSILISYNVTGTNQYKYRWVNIDYILTATQGKNIKCTSNVTVYKRPGGAKYGTIYPNDTCWISKNVSGSYVQLRYPIGNNQYKMGFISVNDLKYFPGYQSSNNTRSTYNDVFASLKGKGYSLSQAKSAASTSFNKGDFVYVWGWLHDANDNLYKSYGSGTCNMTLSIYRPDGSCAYTYTYNNSDNNWIGQKLDQAGTWKIQCQITGALKGTNTKNITVKNTDVRSTYNDVFASLKGKGYSLSQAKSSASTSFNKGDFVYVWGWLHDANNNLYKSYGSGTCNMTLSIYRPDGSCAYTYTYNNSDNNWIGQKLDQAGTWKIQCQITGALKGTNTRSITVKDNGSSDFIKESSLKSAAANYGIDTNSNAYAALKLINTKYAQKLSDSDKRGVLVFMFEGVGNNSSTSKRENAMCVVVKNGNIVYINRNSSSIPDYPFSPSKNDNTPMPTLKSGVYNFSTLNHKGNYAALHINGDANVVRFRSTNDWYSSTSSAINIHRKSSDSVADWNKSWVNSAGCQLIGKTGTSSSSEYAKFIQSVGIVNSNASGDSKYSYSVNGKYILDRSYAYNYMRSIGYSDSAIKAIG